jgi:hypothetical protein
MVLWCVLFGIYAGGGRIIRHDSARAVAKLQAVIRRIYFRITPQL